MSLLGYPKVIPYAKFKHFGIIHFWVMLWTNKQTHRRTRTIYSCQLTQSEWVIIWSNVCHYSYCNFVTIVIVTFTVRVQHYGNCIYSKKYYAYSVTVNIAVKCNWHHHQLTGRVQRLHKALRSCCSTGVDVTYCSLHVSAVTVVIVY